MAKIILISWRENLEKITLTKLQVNILRIGLNESKKNVDLLLEDKTVILEVDNLKSAENFLIEANKIGVNCELILN